MKYPIAAPSRNPMFETPVAKEILSDGNNATAKRPGTVTNTMKFDLAIPLNNEINLSTMNDSDFFI